MANTQTKRGPGRPKKEPKTDTVVNEQSSDHLSMASQIPQSTNISIKDITAQWVGAYSEVLRLQNNTTAVHTDGMSGASMDRWNRLNPFLQNQRLKMLNESPASFSKESLSDALQHPENNEGMLQSVGWYLSSSQQIYANILNRARDVPMYKWYITPGYQEKESVYASPEYLDEYRLATQWCETMDIPLSLKTDSLDVKRNGKVAYLLRSSIADGKTVKFATLQKMPMRWVKITGMGQLGYTISFNMMYFMNLANSPKYFGEFIEKAWAQMMEDGVVTRREGTFSQLRANAGDYEFHPDKARNFKFSYLGTEYTSSIQSDSKTESYMFWLKMPYDLCYVIGSDLSHSWVTPDTMGMLLGLQELSDYSKLAGLIQSTPLTAILTGEAEYTTDAQPGKTQTKIGPEVLRGLQDIFNAMSSTNVEAFFAPLKDIKLQQLNADVNSSTIVSDATQNFITQSGEGGLVVTDSKPNVAQVHGAQYVAEEKERYITLQFENILNFILQHKLGFKYDWKLHLWGSVYTYSEELKYTKELFAAGGKFILPKLLSAEGLDLFDAKAISSFVDHLGLYKTFETPTMEKQAEFNLEAAQKSAEASGKPADGSVKGAGRPSKSAEEVDNENTAASKDAGTNTADNRD